MVCLPTKKEQIDFHKARVNEYGSLMYGNPGKYTRCYGQGIPPGYEEEIKGLRKLRNWHQKQLDKLRSEQDEDSEDPFAKYWQTIVVNVYGTIRVARVRVV